MKAVEMMYKQGILWRIKFQKRPTKIRVGAYELQYFPLFESMSQLLQHNRLQVNQSHVQYLRKYVDLQIERMVAQ
jgi:hypothetical protein